MYWPLQKSAVSVQFVTHLEKSPTEAYYIAFLSITAVIPSFILENKPNSQTSSMLFTPTFGLPSTTTQKLSAKNF